MTKTGESSSISLGFIDCPSSGSVTCEYPSALTRTQRSHIRMVPDRRNGPVIPDVKNSKSMTASPSSSVSAPFDVMSLFSGVRDSASEYGPSGIDIGPSKTTLFAFRIGEAVSPSITRTRTWSVRRPTQEMESNSPVASPNKMKPERTIPAETLQRTKRCRLLACSAINLHRHLIGPLFGPLFGPADTGGNITTSFQFVGVETSRKTSAEQTGRQIQCRHEGES